jgi:bifunctional non-homologous end joining protein LigD
VQASKFSVDVIIDGECVGDVLFAFNLLQLGEDSIVNRPYKERLALLIDLLDVPGLSHIEVVRTAVTSSEKRSLYRRIEQDKKEGIVLKRLDAPYTAGRPASGGPQLKYKFCATLSAVVSKVNPQRSVEIRLLNGEGWVTGGNVTIPGNHQVPKVGAVVEVRYLYAITGSGCLYQPVYLGVRTDIGQHECVVSQLKFKS